MRLAVVGWATDSGVGRELIDTVRNLPVTAAYILPSPNKPSRIDLLQGIPGYQSHGQSPQVEMHAFLQQYKPDVMLTWEVPGDWTFPNMWRAAGIRWLHVVHLDYFDPAYLDTWKMAKLIAPNEACKGYLHALGLQSFVLPVPIDTKRIAFKERRYALKYLSVYGYGGPEDRRSLREILETWRVMKETPKLTIRTQCELELPQEQMLPENVEVKVETVPEPGDLFTGFDIAVQTSRYEGVGITMLEAQAAGVPVITTNAAPMNEIAPDLLVQYGKMEKIKLAGKDLEVYIPSVEALRKVIGGTMGRDIRELSRKARKRVEEKYSWAVLRQQWLDLLAGAPIGSKK
jgi:glycosyltransferase involved in cell wall biosynthesis